MKDCYLDTNVLLSRYKLEDPFYRESIRIVKALKELEIGGYTSALTIVEACSFVSRHFPSRKGENAREARTLAISKTLRELAELRLTFISPPGDYPLLLGGQQIQMPAIFHHALGVALEASMRTLDLLHLSSAKYARQSGSDIRGFITGDNEFIKNRKLIANIIEMPVLSPRELVQSVGLK